MKSDSNTHAIVSDLIDSLGIVQAELQKVQQALQNLEPRALAKVHDPAIKARARKRPVVQFARLVSP